MVHFLSLLPVPPASMMLVGGGFSRRTKCKNACERRAAGAGRAAGHNEQVNVRGLFYNLLTGGTPPFRPVGADSPLGQKAKRVAQEKLEGRQPEVSHHGIA
jgi:hypothetical protein